MSEAAPESSMLAEHRAVWQGKPVLRAVYQDCYARILAACVDGRTLEIGGGTGNLKSFRPDIVSTEIQLAPWLDAVADAHDLPFANGSFRNVVMFDVLHHLERPLRFLNEAARVLAPGGRVVMVEPAVTVGSWPFYKFLHPEPLRMGDDAFADGPRDPARDPYDANQAIPTLLFLRGQQRLTQACPTLRLIDVHRFAWLVYPLSGGFRRWSLVPRAALSAMLSVDRALEGPLGALAGFRMIAVMERA
jgi:SAM-dependent methyltransferase